MGDVKWSEERLSCLFSPSGEKSSCFFFPSLLVAVAPVTDFLFAVAIVGSHECFTSFVGSRRPADQPTRGGVFPVKLLW